MSKLSRTKGHSFERYIAQVFKAMGFEGAKRQLEYQADTAQGIDLANTGPFKVQCKKTKKYVPLNTIKEVQIKNPQKEIPVLIAAGDRQEPLVTLPLWAFVWLAGKKRAFRLNADFEDGMLEAKQLLSSLKENDKTDT